MHLGLGFRVWGLGFRVSGLGFRLWAPEKLLGGSWYISTQVYLHLKPNDSHVRALQGLTSGL